VLGSAQIALKGKNHKKQDFLVEIRAGLGMFVGLDVAFISSVWAT
jgi:hypothetical protein